MLEVVEGFCEKIISGEYNSGRLERYAVERYLDDRANAEEKGLYFDEESALQALNFFPVLRHTTGEFAGQKFIPREFQAFIIANLFGWRQIRDDLRRFRQAYLSFARGNGKSPFAAAVANFSFLNPRDPRAQVYSFATKEEQARIVWEEARKQLECSRSKSILELVEFYKTSMAITKEPWNGSSFQARGSDSKKSDGWILSTGIRDELHAWTNNQRGLLEKIETATSKRAEPLIIDITTAGDEDSILWQEIYDYAVSVVTPDTGINDERLFAYICEIDKDEECPKCKGQGCKKCKGNGVVGLDPLREDLWEQSNPMLREPNSPVKLEGLRSLAQKAKTVPAVLNTFRRYHANQQVASFFKLISPELWSRGNGKLTSLEGLPCHVGFDWGWRNDLASIGLVFPFDDRFELLSYSWIPQGCERNLSQEPWYSFIKRGELTVTDGNSTDIEVIFAHMEWIMKTFEVKSMAFDPANCREFGTRCHNQWGLPTIEFRQNCSNYNEPTRRFVDALKKGQIIHGNNGLLGWCAKNVSAKEDGNEYLMPSKVKSEDKIDPIVALIMAFRAAFLEEEEPPPQLYI